MTLGVRFLLFLMLGALASCTLDKTAADDAADDARESQIGKEPPITTPGNDQCEIGGELNKFGRVELVCQGLAGDELDAKTFTDYRFNVTFSKGGQTFIVPGHFAADGRSADSGAGKGNRWRAYFAPPTTGTWNYQVSFRQGTNVAVSTEPSAGAAVAPFNDKSGSFDIGSIVATLPDMRARGLLRHVSGERLLRFSLDNTLFVEAGMNSPENIFGYSDFDNTVKFFNTSSCKGILHDFEPHLDDWNEGDPTWRDGKGKALIGLINYIGSRGVNAIYMMGMTVNGDGCDAHPWTTYNSSGTEKSFDVSKLDQWERAFRHMERKGIMIHYVTQETENDQLLNGGDLGLERKLYYREIISRFGHHSALQWNVGEENTNSSAQVKAFTRYIKDMDAYDHPILMHTYPDQTDRYDDVLGHASLDGASMQISNISQGTGASSVYGKAKSWLEKSEDEGHQWIVTFTEASGADAPRPNQTVTKQQRVYWMWASVMSGGAGFEWYLKGEEGAAGDAPAHDLAVEDLREFDNYWLQTGYFSSFFDDIVQRGKGIDLTELAIDNDVTSTTNDWVLAKSGETYLIVLRDGGSSNIDLPDYNIYEVLWFNPRTGESHIGDDIQGAGSRPLGFAPNQIHQDWVVLVTMKSEQTGNGATYDESNGIVVIEAENTISPLSQWDERTSLANFTGEGYLEFDGNSYINGPADSPLEYTFKINRGGLYHLHLRSAKTRVNRRNDVANDAYVRVEGDYTSGGSTPLNFLKTDTKFFGGRNDRFAWASGNRLDRDHQKWHATYQFRAGKTYRLVMSGRSRFFKVDRIVFRHDDVDVNAAQNTELLETR
jgi:hypothetical protein